jgi:hypothetical protein
VEVGDALGGRCRQDGAADEENPAPQSATFTGARSVVSKNGIGWKRKSPAMTLPGND